MLRRSYGYAGLLLALVKGFKGLRGRYNKDVSKDVSGFDKGVVVRSYKVLQRPCKGSAMIWYGSLLRL